MQHTYSRAWWAPGVFATACFLFSYRQTIQGLMHQWLHNEDYSHGLLIVPIAMYLVWRKRTELKEVPLQPDWKALPVLFLGIVVFVLGELGAELFTTRLSMLVFVVGLVWLLYGLQVLKVLRFPLAFLFLMLPLPGFIYRNVTFPLQLSASTGSVHLLQSLGISVYREGNVIDMGFMHFQILEACNGLRYILPLLTLGILFAYFGQKAAWKRATLIVATVPIAVTANIMRIAGTGVIGMHWGKEAAEGFFHSFSGWAVFMICVLFFTSLSVLLRFLPERSKEKRTKSLRFDRAGTQRIIKWTPPIVATVIALATPSMVNHLGHVSPVHLHRSLKEFPTIVQGWSGTKSHMEPKIWKRVGGQDYVMIDYHKPDMTPIQFYVAYYEYQRKAGDFVHSPRLCLPGAGWFIKTNRIRNLTQGKPDLVSPLELKLNELLIQKNDRKQLVYFWYQGRGRNFTNEFAAKFYMVWDGLWRRRTDGALVRLTMPLGGRITPGVARSILDPFALTISRTLDEYLP